MLAIRGVRQAGLTRLPHPAAWASVVVVALTVPGTVWQLNTAHRMVRPQPGNSNFITHSERRALNYLAHDPRTGGVITRLYLGQLVPGFTGRRTFVGDCLWSQPGCHARLGAVRTLFEGSMKPAAAKKFVRDRDARFVLTDCRQDINLRHMLGSLITAVHRFGCAAVYDVE